MPINEPTVGATGWDTWGNALTTLANTLESTAVRRLVEVNGVYPTRPSTGLVDFLGITDPSSVMLTGDTWTQLPPAVPNAPTIGTATAGDTSATVAFTAPTWNGGATITGYTATSNPGAVTGTGASSPITVSGLSNAVAYTFKVKATNSVGVGAESASSNSVTPTGTSVAPTYGAASTPPSWVNATTVQVPAPSGVVSGSVVLVVLARDDLTSYENPTAPGGWTKVPDNPGFASATNSAHTFNADVFWHRASGSESGTYDFSWTTGAWRSGVAVRLDGCRASGNPFEVDDGAASTGGVTSTSTPAVSVTTTGDNRLLVWVGWSWTSSTWTQPTGYTTRVSNMPFDTAFVATKVQAAAGATGSVTGTQGNEVHAAWLGAFVGT